MDQTEPTYLGDSVYASMDGGMIKLVADRTQVIYLEPEVYRALVRYAAANGITPPATMTGSPW